AESSVNVPRVSVAPALQVNVPPSKVNVRSFSLSSGALRPDFSPAETIQAPWIFSRSPSSPAWAVAGLPARSINSAAVAAIVLIRRLLVPRSPRTNPHEESCAGPGKVHRPPSMGPDPRKVLEPEPSRGPGHSGMGGVPLTAPIRFW